MAGDDDKAFRPAKPKMGDIIQVSTSEWCAWTGGKPKSDWSGLDDKAAASPSDDYQLRPSSPGSSQKSTKVRETGLDTKFGRNSHLLDFVDVVKAYLERTGMDTISYLEDPSNAGTVVSVVHNYSKFSLADAIASARKLRTDSFDKYDRNNDDSARNWLLDSLEPELKKDVTDRLHPQDGFVAHWLQLIHLVQSTSFNRFTVIKRDIESNLSLLKIPGQNVKELASIFLSKARELDNHGFYEHRLTLCMLDRFLEGGGTNSDVPTMQYRHTLFQLRQKLDKALIEIGRLETDSQNKHMAKENLTYRDICAIAEEEWRKLFDDNKWAPAKTKNDTRRAPANFGANMVETCQPIGKNLTEPMALALMQQLKSNYNSAKAKTECHKCGQLGHWARECKNKPKEQEKTDETSDKKDQQKKMSWKQVPPSSSNPSCTKLGNEFGHPKWKQVHNGKTFYWCQKCGRWSTTHWTAEHKKDVKKGTEQPSSYLAAATGGITLSDWPCAFYGEIEKGYGGDPDFWTLLAPYAPLFFLFIRWALETTYAPVLWFTLGWILAEGPANLVYCLVNDLKGPKRNVWKRFKKSLRRFRRSTFLHHRHRRNQASCKKVQKKKSRPPRPIAGASFGHSTGSAFRPYETCCFKARAGHRNCKLPKNL